MPLTEKHIKIQAAIAVQAMRDTGVIFTAFNPAAIDETWRAVEKGLLLLAEKRRTQSLAVADSYYKTVRRAEGITTALPVILPEMEEWRPAARASLHITGVAWSKTAIAEDTILSFVKTEALKRVSGVMTRTVLDGGRDQVSRYVRAERIRYRRVTSGRACDFCRMLAGRGAVYGEDTGSFQSHDHCSCSAEPVFRRAA